MAKKEESAKVVLERVYTVPLRRFWLYTPKYRRAKRAVNALKDFMMKHMKATEVKIGKYANQEIWKRGIKSPPHHIKVEAKKDDKGIVMVELVGAPTEKPKKEKKPKIPKETKLEEKVVPQKETIAHHDHAGHEHHDHTAHEHKAEPKKAKEKK